MKELYCVLATPSLEVYHDEARGWLYTRWLGEHTQASIQRAIDTVCVYLRDNSYIKILSDHSALIGNWPAESFWEMQPYFDALAAHGILYFAWVYNDSHHNRTVMEQTLRTVEHPAVAAFKDVASAYEWLCRCAAAPVANTSKQGGLEHPPMFS